MKKLIFSGLVFLLPALALAANFATDPLFLSRSPVTEGQSVHIYAVISNPDADAFAGTLVFYDNNARIGDTAVSLAAGATETASIDWAPTAGTHPITAQLVESDGTIAEQVSQSFTVNPKPEPADSGSAQTAATIDSSAPIQQDIANVSPQVASASAPAFSIIDSARNSIADALDGQINSIKQKIAATPNPGLILGTSTQSALTDQQLPSESGVWYWLYTIYLYLLEALRWLVGNAGVFYPFIAIVFLYFLWRMYRRFRRPAWQR